MRTKVWIAASALVLTAGALAQGPPGPPRRPTGPARDVAPVDFTGTWVSPIMEDWRWRMVTPLKGDAASVPLKAEARKIVDAWDPAKDEAEGQQCKAYGAPGLMRLPGRLRISWEDENTLKIETDAGTQTRVLHFGGAPPADLAPSRQGYSSARWDPGLPRPIGLGFSIGGTRVGGKSRTLEVVTTHLLPGYLRKNGVPFSAETKVEEYFDRFSESDAEWFTITTVVTDPVYLAIPFITTTDFRKEPDDSRFNPKPCSAR
jgi:hypothetical protein